MKVKVGDVVRITRDKPCCSALYEGELCTVTTVIGYSYGVRSVSPMSIYEHTTWWIGADCFELQSSDTAVTLKFKRLDVNAVVPSYAKPGDAGLDLTATTKEWDEEHKVLVFGTGLAIEVPKGFVGLIFPRSSIYKSPLMLSNSVGVIDSGYRGEIKFMFRPTDRPRKSYEVGDRIGQLILIPYPHVEVLEVDELSSTERGSEGFGSSGA